MSDPGERGVVYEAYELGERPEWSVIFQSGRHDEFSPCDVDFFLDVTGEVCEELAGYTFENVPRLVDDFGRGDFTPAINHQFTLLLVLTVHLDNPVFYVPRF